MPAFICDPELERRLRAERALTGADRFDEVWEGIYVMAPLANNEHQQIVSRLIAIFEQTVGWPGLGRVFPGVNISDRVEDWESNYRCPEVAVFLNETTATDHGAFWRGGPDLAVEVVSEGDRSLEKIPFYARVGTRELLIIDRQPWKLELYRLAGDTLTLSGSSERPGCAVLQDAVMDLEFQLVSGSARPRTRVTHVPSQQQWDV